MRFYKVIGFDNDDDKTSAVFVLTGNINEWIHSIENESPQFRVLSFKEISGDELPQITVVIQK